MTNHNSPQPTEQPEGEIELNDVVYELVASLSFGGFLNCRVSTEEATEHINRFLSRVIPCTHCKGNGLVNEPGKPEKHDCAYCDGTGFALPSQPGESVDALGEEAMFEKWESLIPEVLRKLLSDFALEHTYPVRGILRNLFKNALASQVDAEPSPQEAVEMGICVRCQKRDATKDYNGHKHYVCDPCYDMLSDEFDEDYK